MLPLLMRHVQIALAVILLVDAAGLGALALLDILEKRRARDARG